MRDREHGVTQSYKQALLSLKIPPVPQFYEHEEKEDDEQIRGMIKMINNLLTDTKEQSRQESSRFSEPSATEVLPKRPEGSHKFFRTLNMSPI